jgi:hypothetical protein
MSRTPLHIARVSNDDPPKIEVLDSNEIARGFLEVAVELWQLAGREDRASAIEKLITSAYRADPPRWARAQITRLRELLDGLEQALIGPVTDEHHLLSPERIHELRGRVDAIDLGGFPGSNATYAVQEALVYIDRLRDIAEGALESDACILFD